jgi:hypothetical protein
MRDCAIEGSVFYLLLNGNFQLIGRLGGSVVCRLGGSAIFAD